MGIDFKLLNIKIDEKKITLQILNPSGAERFYITSSCYKGCHGIIVTYDITDRRSFERVEFWMN